MKAHLFSGWAFPRSALQPIADQLGVTVTRDPAEATLWIGWSLGGLRALWLSGERLTRGVSAPRVLVLLASTARFCGDGGHWLGQPIGRLRALERRLAHAPDAALRGFHALCAGAEATPEILDARRRASLSLDPEELVEGLRALAELDLRETLASLSIPVLILHGAGDRVIPLPAAHAVAERLSDVRLLEHPTAGHDLPLTHTAWVVGHIRDFLGDCACRAARARESNRRVDDLEQNTV
jgi:pimeloyl-[acyl-carrier protein] methyl ester esterase